MNFTSSAEALDVAARENAASDKSIHELQDLVKKIALKEKIEESREFASNVQHALHSGLAAKSPGIRDRGVKKAPFIVLIGANMPSILAEISFVSNPGDERRLRTPEYRQRIAESLYRGISKYVSGLSGVKVPAKIDKRRRPIVLLIASWLQIFPSAVSSRLAPMLSNFRRCAELPLRRKLSGLVCSLIIEGCRPRSVPHEGF